MITVNTSVQFTAEDRADAEAKIASWRLHEGCVVVSHLSEQLDAQETVEGSGGELTRQPTADELMAETELAAQGNGNDTSS
jgi:hypothetical protein